MFTTVFFQITCCITYTTLLFAVLVVFTNVFLQIIICKTSQTIIVAFSNKFKIIYHFLQLLFAVLVDLSGQNVYIFAVLLFQTAKNSILMFTNIFLTIIICTTYFILCSISIKLLLQSELFVTYVFTLKNDISRFLEYFCGNKLLFAKAIENQSFVFVYFLIKVV